MGQQTSTITTASDFDPTQARLTGADGGTPISTAITYGQDDTGTDFKVFGATSGAYMLWDESADFFKLVNGGIQIGTLSSTTQTGYPLTSTNNNVIDSFADDNNVTLTNAVYSNIRARTMLFKSATGITLISLKGQIKSADAVDFGPGVYAGVQGYMELVDESDIEDGAKYWGVDSSIDVPTGGTIDVKSGGIAAGFHAELTGAGTATQSSGGILAGLYIDKQITSGKWGYGIYMTAGSANKAIRIGSLSSTTAGSGMLVDATHTRAVEVHVDDNDTARAVGTQGRAIFGRTMIYANNACEDWGIDGLSKISGVAKTGNVSAGVVGRFESTGTCSTATGSGNTFVAGVMGRLGLAVNFTLGAGTYACGVLSFYNTAAASDPTGETTAAFLATASDIAGTGDWDYGLLLDASTVGEGIRILTVSGNGINFPAGETYAKAIAIGEFGTPVLYGTDELIEYHGRHNSGTETKPMMRVRASAPASTAMTTGFVTGFQCQAYGTDTSDVGGLEAIQAHVGIKGNCEIIADITALHPNMRAGWFKIEDLGNDLTLTGTAAVLILGMQWNTGTTLTGNCDWLNLQKRGSLTDPADAFVRVYDGAGGGWATNLFDIPATLPYSAANSSGTQSGKIAMNVGGATKYLQCYSD